jgi:hypothetical protein
LESNLAIVNL